MAPILVESHLKCFKLIFAYFCINLRYKIFQGQHESVVLCTNVLYVNVFG